MLYEVAKIRDADGLEFDRTVVLAEDAQQALEIGGEFLRAAADCDVPYHFEIVGEMPESQISK